MSDDELSDDMQELNELIAEYRSKEEEVKDEQQQEDIKEDKRSSDAQALLGRALFGDKTQLLKNMEKVVEKPFMESDKNYKEIVSEDENDINRKKLKKRKPVWTDADDEEIQLGEVKRRTKHTGPLHHLKMENSYKEYLTSRFTRIVNQPKWASLEGKVDERNNEDDALLRSVGFLNKSPEGILSSGRIKIKRMKDINRSTYAEGRINSIQFHPTSTAALVAGERGVASIYAIDGTRNDKLHNIHIADFPIRCASILPCGTKAIFGSNRYYAYMYDLINAKETRFNLLKDFGSLCNFKVSPCGSYLVAGTGCGEIHIYEAKTFEIIRTLKQNDAVSSICFTSDSKRLIVSGKSPVVNIFSMRQQRLEHKFIDDGCIVGSAMDLSPNQKLLATGSKEGVVNVYNFDKVMASSDPQPEKRFLNLTTEISSVRFNHTSELMAFCSGAYKDAVKMAHFPSGTVYANFPGNLPRFGHVQKLEFSPQSAYFAMGAEKKCPLFRIKHFENY